VLAEIELSSCRLRVRALLVKGLEPLGSVVCKDDGFSPNFGIVILARSSRLSIFSDLLLREI
jgi:hypothetical protein